MSTIVKYKNNTLTTVENETKTIKTANKWMEDNLVFEKTDSENPAIHQDVNGYIVLDDDGNRVSTKSLTANNNSTYTAPTGFAYNNISVRVPVSNVTKKIIDRSIVNIKAEDFPNLTTIGHDAFRECVNLTEVNLPTSVTSIGGYAFYNCKNLISVELPVNIKTINEFTFYGCESLRTLNFDYITSAYNNAFNGINVIEINAPVLSSVSGTRIFANCKNCNTIKLPQITGFTSSQGYAFEHCSSLKNISIPKVTDLPLYTFSGCTSLEILDFPLVKSVGNYVFVNDTMLSTLIFRNTIVSTLGNINAFNGTPFASGGTGGTLYVPSALISSYQSATNWSTILGYTNNQILPIEGSIYETQYADGTPISS